VLVVLVVLALCHQLAAPHAVAAVVVVVALFAFGYRMHHSIRQKPMPSAQVVLAQHRATAAQEERHYSVCTLKPKAEAEALLEDSLYDLLLLAETRY